MTCITTKVLVRGCMDTWKCTLKMIPQACCLQVTQTTFPIQNEDFCLLPGETERRGGREELSLRNSEHLELAIWRPLLEIYLSRVHSLFIACGLTVILLSQDVSTDLLRVGLIKYHFRTFRPN